MRWVRGNERYNRKGKRDTFTKTKGNGVTWEDFQGDINSQWIHLTLWDCEKRSCHVKAAFFWRGGELETDNN